MLHIAELRELAKCIHRHLDVHERRIGRLTEDALDDAEAWATTRVGAAYALLTPAIGTDDHLEVLDDALDQIGHHAINPRFQACTTSLPDAARLGEVALVRFADLPAADRWTRPAAKAGHPDAMIDLGLLLQQRRGDGDLTQAEEWYRRAADAGNTRATIDLGLLLRQRGSDFDLAEAEEWYLRAAEAGNTDAMFSLGSGLQERGGFLDPLVAELWYRRAAAAGHTPRHVQPWRSARGER